MGKIITFSNNKGGVLKTTLAVNFAVWLAKEKEKKTLIIDLDAQGNVFNTFGGNRDEINFSIFDLMFNNATYSDVLKKLKIEEIKEKLAIIPANKNMEKLEKFFYTTKPQKTIGMFLNYFKKNFDYVVIDTSPSLSDFNLSVLSYSDEIIVPFDISSYSISGLFNLWERLNKIKRPIRGIVATKTSSRSKLELEALEQLKEDEIFNRLLLENKISRSVRVATEATYNEIPILLSKYKSKVKNDIYNFSEELYERIK